MGALLEIELGEERQGQPHHGIAGGRSSKGGNVRNGLTVGALGGDRGGEKTPGTALFWVENVRLVPFIHYGIGAAAGTELVISEKVVLDDG